MKITKDILENQDCLKLLRGLPSNSIDLVVSSPPYNIGKEYETKIALNEYLKAQREVLTECVRVLKKTGSIFWQIGSFSDSGIIIPLDIRLFPMLEELGLTPRNRIIWARQHGLHASKKFSGRHETILWFSKSSDYKFRLDEVRVPQKYQNKKSHRGANKGELTCNPDGKNPGDIWVFRNVKHNHEEQTIHPCQFPEDMIARIILATTDESDVICDPYMGTGTVAVVARDHNRRYVGSEIDPLYFEVAQRRLSGKPDKERKFANLKCLRAYITKTREPIENYRFDVQVGVKATEVEKAKIFPEEHHRQELALRLQYEEDIFSAKRKGEESEDRQSFKPKKATYEQKHDKREAVMNNQKHGDVWLLKHTP